MHKNINTVRLVDITQKHPKNDNQVSQTVSRKIILYNVANTDLVKLPTASFMQQHELAMNSTTV